MKKLAERINMKFGIVEGAHVMRHVNLGLEAYGTLYLICVRFDINPEDFPESDFDSTALVLENFCRSANDHTGYTVSVWFD